MAITLDAVSSGRNSSGDITVSHTTASMSQGVMYVMTTVQDSNHANYPVIGITYNGVALTKIRSDEGAGSRNVRTEIWRLIDPDAGTHDVDVNVTGSVGEFTCHVITMDNVDQTTPEEDNQGDEGSGSTPSIGVTTVNDGAWILTISAAEASFSSNGTGQTTIATETDQSYENGRSSREEKATAGADTQSFNLSSGQPWAISSVVVRPAVSGTDVNDARSAKITGSVTGDFNISTVGASSIGKNTATLTGDITAIDSPAPTVRGFEYGNSKYGDKIVQETGLFSEGAYNLNISNLSAGVDYFFRAFATDSNGTIYGSWLSFTTTESTYNLTINDIDRTADVLNETIMVKDIINDRQNTISFIMIDRSGNGVPDPDEEIVLTAEDGTKLFGGFITEVHLQTHGSGVVQMVIQGIDYVRLLDRNLVHKTYEDMTDKAIIEDIVSRYADGSGITTSNVLEGVTIDQISFNYVQPSQALRRLSELTGRNWYIDYDKDIHYFPTTTATAPFDIDDTTTSGYRKLKIIKDATQLKNRVYVRGGTKLSDQTTYSEKGDGEKIKFVLPDKPHNVSVTVNGSPKTLGIKHIDTSGYDWYLNYQEKYIEQDAGGSVLTSSDTLEITYKYDIPILVALENAASISEHGQHEFAIFDKQITTTEAARDRASAELTDYANNLVEGSFETFEDGFISGQYINIDLTAYDIDADYIVQKVTARSFGAGNFIYEVEVASAKTIGIIKFLIELLESNRNIIELDDNESVDELFNLTDSLLSDSLIDSLIIDSAGPYRTWCEDSLEATETRARWGLFEWGGNS